ncbi:MAG: BrnT family toxin [Treponema sp.]|nr:BrnT family toxin [Treponema sp.]
MKFEWDEKKNLVNIKKHGINFDLAVYVFTDPLRREGYDTRHSSIGEDRTYAIGMAESRLLFVNFTEPDTDTVHIISARKANKRERRYYYGKG